MIGVIYERAGQVEVHVYVFKARVVSKCGWGFHMKSSPKGGGKDV